MKPLDVRLHEAAAQATRLFVEAARSNHTKSDFLIHEDPAGDMTVASLVFTILHTGAEPVSIDAYKAAQSPQEASQSVVEEKVEEVPMKMRVDDAPPPDFPDQSVCARPGCHKPKWKHYADENGGYQTCREFVDRAQFSLV